MKENLCNQPEQLQNNQKSQRVKSPNAHILNNKIAVD